MLEASKIDQLKKRDHLKAKKHWCWAFTKRILGPLDEGQTCCWQWRSDSLVNSSFFSRQHCTYQFFFRLLHTIIEIYPFESCPIFYRTTHLWKLVFTNQEKSQFMKLSRSWKFVVLQYSMWLVFWQMSLINVLPARYYLQRAGATKRKRDLREDLDSDRLATFVCTIWDRMLPRALTHCAKADVRITMPWFATWN